LTWQFTVGTLKITRANANYSGLGITINYMDASIIDLDVSFTPVLTNQLYWVAAKLDQFAAVRRNNLTGGPQHFQLINQIPTVGNHSINVTISNMGNSLQTQITLPFTVTSMTSPPPLNYDYIAIAVSGADPQPEGNNSWVVTGQLQDVANNNSFAAIPGVSLDLIQDGIRINTSVTDANGHVSSQIVNLPPGTHSLRWHDPAKNLDSGTITVTVTPANGGGGGGGGGGTVPPVDFFGILHAFKMAAIFGGLILAGVIDYRGRRKRR